jgi:hypothetical protein
MCEDSWAVSYRTWGQVYDSVADVTRAVIREKITQALERTQNSEEQV